MKKRFQFSLERLQKVRDAQERMARAEWAAAAAIAGEAHQRLEATRTELAEARNQSLNLRSSKHLDARELMAGEKLIHHILQRLRKRREEHISAESRARELQVAWSVRSGEHKALIKLEENARHSHQKELQKLENEELDEISGVRWASSKSAEKYSSQARQVPIGPHSTP